MKCEEIQSLIQEEAKRLLASWEREEVERHIARCPGCRRERREISGVVELLNHLTVPGIPSRFMDGVFEKLNKGIIPGIVRISTWQTVGLIAFAYLLSWGG